MLPIGANLRKQFKILMADVEKADQFTNLYLDHVFQEKLEYPNVHRNLLTELRALQPTISKLAGATSQLVGQASIYRDLNMRLKPFEQKLNLVAVAVRQRILEKERERTERILKLSLIHI